MDLIESIEERVRAHWADDVEILGAWYDGPASGYLVYRRLLEPATVLGCRLEFNERAAGGTIESYASDVAVNLAEPVGSAHTARDEHGITWVGVPRRALPVVPASVRDRL